MTFLVDAQLPPALAHWLQLQGHAAQHLEDLGMRDAEDAMVWNHAASSGATIVTKDEDFAERAARDTSGPIVVWLRVGNTTNQALLEWLAPRWLDVVMLLDAGNRIIEVR
jgi:predicted nuclease of predicted toxin-antitoxin system